MFTKSRFFLTTYPPPLVNVVCERPLSMIDNKKHICFSHRKLFLTLQVWNFNYFCFPSTETLLPCEGKKAICELRRFLASHARTFAHSIFGRTHILCVLPKIHFAPARYGKRVTFKQILPKNVHN